MDRTSRERLRLDRRLIGRRGHISREELERALAELPDVASKAVPLVVEGAAGGAAPPAEEPGS